MAANAADVPPDARPVAPPVYLSQPFSWTGFYIGPNLGGAWRQRNLPDTLLGLSLSNVNDKGAFIGGGQLGFNYQFGNFVLGIEADVDGGCNHQQSGYGSCWPSLWNDPSDFQQQVDHDPGWPVRRHERHLAVLWQGRRRLGRLRQPHHHQYGDGRIDHRLHQQHHSGWLVGGGIEWAFAPNW